MFIQREYHVQLLKLGRVHCLLLFKKFNGVEIHNSIGLNIPCYMIIDEIFETHCGGVEPLELCIIFVIQRFNMFC